MVENQEVDVVEVQMTEEEINEVIAHLNDLREHKTHVQFPIAADVDLVVHYDSDEEKENN